MKKRYSVFAFLIVIVLLLAACGGGGAPESSGEADAPAQDSAEQPAADGEALRIGYSVATLENAFFVGMTKGVVDEAEAQGAELLQANANGDAATQVNQILDLMTQGVDVLVLNPINADGIVPVVERANEQGIPVITLDRGSSGGEVASFLETDNVAMGQEAAQYIVDELTSRYGEPKGNVVNLQGLRGTTAAESREEGFMGEISKYPDINVVVSQAADFNQEKALNIMSNAIQANPQIDAVFGANDDNAMGAVKAIEQAGLATDPSDENYIYVIGIDGTAQAIEAIRNGTLAGTISQNPVTMAAEAVKIAYQIQAGEESEPHILWPHQLINVDNIESPEVVEYGIWSDADAAAPAEEEAASDAPAEALRVGYSVATLENAFFVGMTKGVVDEAEAQGAELLQANANGDAATQVNQILDLMTQGVDVLVLNPINADGIVPVVERANEQGIPVITLDRGSSGGEVASFLETDNVAMGQEAAQYIVDELTSRYGEPKGNVVNLQGLRGTTAAESREEGFMGEISKYPDIDVVVSQAADFNQEKALNIMSNAIQANPQIDAVFGANDDNAMGAVKAIEQAGLAADPSDENYIYVIGIDGTAQAIEAIRNGTLAGTISQNPVTMAAEAVKIAFRFRPARPRKPIFCGRIS